MSDEKESCFRYKVSYFILIKDYDDFFIAISEQ